MLFFLKKLFYIISLMFFKMLMIKNSIFFILLIQRSVFLRFTLHCSLLQSEQWRTYPLSTLSPSLQLTTSNSSPPTIQKAPILQPTANNSSPLHRGQQQQPLHM
jgi:hypothetical protein